jgi:hypothetical protein
MTPVWNMLRFRSIEISLKRTGIHCRSSPVLIPNASIARARMYHL